MAPDQCYYPWNPVSQCSGEKWRKKLPQKGLACCTGLHCCGHRHEHTRRCLTGIFCLPLTSCLNYSLHLPNIDVEKGRKTGQWSTYVLWGAHLLWSSRAPESSICQKKGTTLPFAAHIKGMLTLFSSCCPASSGLSVVSAHISLVTLAATDTIMFMWIPIVHTHNIGLRANVHAQY